MIAKSRDGVAKIDQSGERTAKLSSSPEQGAELELGHNSATMNDSRSEGAKTHKK